MPRRKQSTRRAPIRTARAYQALTPAQRDAHQRAINALSYVRTDGLSVTEAARRANTTRRTVLKYAGSALTHGKGRYTARASDRLYREMHFLSARGKVVLGVTDSRTASRIAEYWAAVDRYLKTGQTDRLRAFRGKAVSVGKVKYPFLTDPRTLERLGHAGEVSFEDLYARVA